jgi:hypothetical protein
MRWTKWKAAARPRSPTTEFLAKFRAVEGGDRPRHILGCALGSIAGVRIAVVPGSTVEPGLALLARRSTLRDELAPLLKPKRRFPNPGRRGMATSIPNLAGAKNSLKDAMAVDESNKSGR